MSNLCKDIIKSFVIGSSAVIFVPFYIAVTNTPESRIDLKIYAVTASIYFGTMNVLATIIGKVFDLTLFQRLVVIDIISILIVWTLITIDMPYEFKTRGRELLQYVFVAIGHTLAYLVLIYNLERLFS